MNRVITINLNGNAYQLEDSGYEALRQYLDHAARRLEGNPDKNEILADIEQAIADKFRATLGPHKTVVVTLEVTAALEAMGPVQDAGTGESAAGSERTDARGSATDAARPDAGGRAAEAASGAPKRLYAIREGAHLAGVCNGLAAYFGVDPSLVRIAFVVLTLFWGTGVLVYLVLALIVPTAETPAEKAAAHGAAATAQEFIRRAKAGYYEGLKSFQNKESQQEWRRKFRRQMRGWQRGSQYYWNGGRHQWQGPGVTPPVYWGSGAGALLFGLMNAALAVAALYALYTLVTHGHVFGLGLPANVPLWVGIVLVILFWNAVAWPLKVLSWGALGADGTRVRMSGPFGALGDLLIGLAFVAVAIWAADRYVPGAHDALKQVPPLLHQAVDAVQRWLGHG